MAINGTWSVVSMLAIVLGPGAVAAPAPQSGCLAAKTTCVATLAGGRLACSQRALTPGNPPDPNARGCLEAAARRFDGGTRPERGCFERREALAANDCITFDDTSSTAALVSACIDGVVSAVDPPPTTQSTCHAGTLRCVARLSTGLLRCYQRAATPGKPADPNARGCIDRVLDRFEARTSSGGGCVAKLEARVGATCELPGQAATLAAETVSCLESVLETLHGTVATTSTTMPAPTTSTTSTTTTSTTTTSTSSTSTSTSSTTSSTMAVPAFSAVDLVIGTGTGSCGTLRDGDGIAIGDLACGALALGGGTSGVPQAHLPGSSTNRFAVTDCTGPTCTIRAASERTDTVECTSTGCAFGLPLPIANGQLTACAASTFAAPPAGTLDIASGTTTNLSLALATSIWVTGVANVAQPCPRCVTAAAGSLDQPQAGTCDRGARAGLACTTTNPHGLSNGCLPASEPGSLFAGTWSLNLTPLTTSTRTVTAPTGTFCPGQTVAGCFGRSGCRTIEVAGAAAGALLPVGSASPVTLATAFCVPSPPLTLYAFHAAVPGPAALTIAGALRLVP